MRVRIDASWEDHFPCGIDDDIGLHLEFLSDQSDRLALNQNVAVIIIDCGDYSSVFDKCLHLVRGTLKIDNRCTRPAIRT